MRSVTCRNNNTNSSMTFGEQGFTPFYLAHLDGVYEADNNVFISDNTMTDGATYQNSIAKKRNIVITAIADPSNSMYNQANRDALYLLFRKGEMGTFIYTEDGVSREIDYVSERISRMNNKTRAFTISLICPNPMFRDIEPQSVSMASWLGNFEFLHEFVAEGEEFGNKSSERSVNIRNDTARNNIGITVTISCNGTVVNPTITRIESDEKLTVGSEAKPFEMGTGDELIITTATNNKHVRLSRNGRLTEVNEYLTEESEFMQLMYGDNNMTYSAESGEENMSVSIKYTFEYEGA